MSITNENNERDLSLKAIRRLISSNEAPAARVILEEIVSAGGLFGITLQDATRLLEYLEGRLGSDDSLGSLIYAAAEQQADGASLDDTVTELRAKGIGRKDILRLVENIILAEEDDQRRHKMWEVAAILGSKHSLRQMEPGADFARINDGRVEAPEGTDMGAVIYQTDGGKRVQLAMLDDGEFILSKAGVVGLGLEDGASLSDAHARGFKVLFALHDKARVRGRAALSEVDDLSTEPAPLVEQVEGNYRATPELIERVIAVESSGKANAVPEASSEVAYIMLGTLATGFVQVLNFWLGSSRSSQDKSQHLADAARR